MQPHSAIQLAIGLRPVPQAQPDSYSPMWPAWLEGISAPATTAPMPVAAAGASAATAPRT